MCSSLTVGLAIFSNLITTVMVKIIENYCLNQQIGEGQYGKVYKATNLNSKTDVAVKVIRADKFRELPKLQECTINQIDILSKVQHNPHIVKFVQILKTANNYYFVYQYCNGGTLDKVISSLGPLPEKRALFYIKNLFTAFRSLVRMNIMHRDLKPSNILFHNGVLKLADFGFCKSLQSSKDLTQTMLGSPIYMAPEVLKGQIYTIKADIWSLGVVFYEMLFGFCPFEQSSIAKLISLLEETPVRIPRQINNISRTTQDLLLKMLVKDQFKRCSWQDLFDIDISDQGQIRPAHTVITPTKSFDFDVAFKKQGYILSNNRSVSPLRQVSINQQSDRQLFKKKDKPLSPNLSPPSSVNNQQLLSLHSKALLMARRLHSMSWCYHPNPSPYIQQLMNRMLDNVCKMKRSLEMHPLKQKLKDVLDQQEKTLRQAGATDTYVDWMWLKDYLDQLRGFQTKAFSILEQGGRQIVIHAVELLELGVSQKRAVEWPREKSKLNKAELLRWLQEHSKEL